MSEQRKSDRMDQVSLSEEKLATYDQLQEQAKRIEAEIQAIKKEIHEYFDRVCGDTMKGIETFGPYQVTRQIRTSQSYDQNKTVERLEDLNLLDCIEVVRKPNDVKIEAAISLGLLSREDIQSCIKEKQTKAISIKKIGG